MAVSVQREPYDNKKFETAFQAVLQGEKKDYPSYMGGMMVASGVDYPLCSPIDDTILFGTLQEAEPGTAEEMVNNSIKAFKEWSVRPQEERTEIITKIFNNICAQRYKLAAYVLVSSGMTREESLAEVDALIDVLADALNAVDAIAGKPMGPWAIVTSYNSPLASPMGYALSAILVGNTAIVMPSKYCPIPVHVVYGICENCGLPAGVLNLMTDRKDETQIELANDEFLAGVIASGSGKSLEDMMFLMVDDELSFINELKGMNPILVYKPSDMKKAVRDVLDSAFRYSGQGLFSTSKVVLTIEDQKRFTDMIMEQAKLLKIDDPAEPEAFSGPLIGKEVKAQFDEVASKVAGYTICGGKKVSSEFTQNGSYVTPLIVTGLDDEDDMAYMDFGIPFLYIKTVSDIDEAFEELAYTECGLSAGIYSKDPKIIERFKNESDLPYLFINESSRSLRPAVHAKLENFVR
ncbi:MAG: aldehyde dehydrogenase family protein [Candidatus Methanomethylophilaceae archaeon]